MNFTKLNTQHKLVLYYKVTIKKFVIFILDMSIKIRIGWLTLPSAVTAANTVDEYGAQATSPTELLKSNVNIGSLQGML